jgi:ubiquinone/menaquinone biosynthesis C-methylase UbiE
MQTNRRCFDDRLGIVRDAYAKRAQEYAAKFGSIQSVAEQDKRVVATWADEVDGKIIDVGCGPGQWTNHLREMGADVEGIDPVSALIDEAMLRYPEASFRLGHAERIDEDNAGVGGILAWYSLIHCDPDQIDRAFAEFARVLRPGGGLLVGFFEGPALEPFDHAVTTAYFWPVPALVRVIEGAGFDVTQTHARADPGVRPHGAIVAVRQRSP